MLNPDKLEAVTEDGATTLEWTRRLLVAIPEEFEVKLEVKLEPIPDVELEMVELATDVLKDIVMDCKGFVSS